EAGPLIDGAEIAKTRTIVQMREHEALPIGQKEGYAAAIDGDIAVKRAIIGDRALSRRSIGRNGEGKASQQHRPRHKHLHPFPPERKPDRRLSPFCIAYRRKSSRPQRLLARGWRFGKGNGARRLERFTV